jgi:hypothetical protein
MTTPSCYLVILSYVGIWTHTYAAGITTTAKNAVLAHQLENSNPTKQVSKGRGGSGYLIPVDIKDETFNIHKLWPCMQM